jgi:hypothetical protein
MSDGVGQTNTLDVVGTSVHKGGSAGNIYSAKDCGIYCYANFIVLFPVLRIGTIALGNVFLDIKTITA